MRGEGGDKGDGVNDEICSNKATTHSPPEMNGENG